MDKEVIITILSFVAVLLTFFTKSKKKSTSSDPTSIPGPKESPWDLFEEHDQASKQPTFNYEPIEADAVDRADDSCSTVFSTGSSSSTAAVSEIVLESDEVDQEEFRNAYRLKAQAPTSDQANDIMENFSLRDAVIYSEILRPKYKEY